jgi:hypothetical protein
MKPRLEQSLEELGFTVRKCTQVAELSAIPWTGTCSRDGAVTFQRRLDFCTF